MTVQTGCGGISESGANVIFIENAYPSHAVSLAVTFIKCYTDYQTRIPPEQNTILLNSQLSLH